MFATAVAALTPLLSLAATDTDNQEAVASISGSVTVLNVNGDPLEDRSNTLVFLDGVVVATADLSTENPIKISQRGGRFTPRVLPVVQGATLRFFNDDDTFHNVFSLSRAAPFDLGIYQKGTYKDVKLNSTGVIKIYCNLHPNMASTVVSLNNPWFAITASDGSFVIEQIPPGDYTLRVWHEFGGTFTKPISLAAGGSYTEAMAIQNTGVSRDHTNKFGKPYRDKY